MTRYRNHLPQIDGGFFLTDGGIGPRGDGYRSGLATSEAEAERYHSAQAEVFGETDADMITAITMTNAEEVIGITRAA